MCHFPFFDQFASGEIELTSFFCLRGPVDILFPNSAYQLFQQTQGQQQFCKIVGQTFEGIVSRSECHGTTAGMFVG